MKISIWDTQVNREDGLIMYFEIVVPMNITNEKTICAYGKEYLKKKVFRTNEMSSSKCSFCQIESRSSHIIGQIHSVGYSIVEIENCNA
ncbi:DUF2024 family protein [uncultured Aquimarina sp.]|uniref:DUF2024 family protein n=1 Tax=uncultured Aquimarina sp. TaxID=575652 RepID=UPI00260F5F98|nr:DUF2024 family protein [uncultured Aquimarina sp.]